MGNFDATGGMTYPDFIFFMLSEEDKSSEAALRYWFDCCDLDGDGALSPEEMRFFYAHQIQRVTNLVRDIPPSPYFLPTPFPLCSQE